jgi:hypothetical protein
MTEPTHGDPLDELRDRIQATREAAERLAGEAHGATRARRERQPPPAGWAAPPGSDDTREELRALVGLIDTLRGLIPEELRQQLVDVIRQVLLLLRALIDWWVDRIETERGSEPEVEDIPIS